MSKSVRKISQIYEDPIAEREAHVMWEEKEKRSSKTY